MTQQEVSHVLTRARTDADEVDVSTAQPAGSVETPDAAVKADAAPKLGRKRDHTRDQDIMDAALEILGETGYERMTIDMVATRAKAGKATLYRRWASKGELVIDAVACMKRADLEPSQLPDTGTLRGDLIGMIKPRTIEESERKLQMMAGLMSMLSSAPELAETVNSAMIEPRAAVNRMMLRRAIGRGEIPSTIDVDTLALVSQSMVTYRVIMLRKPVDSEFLISIIDSVIMPAVGLGNGGASHSTPGTA